MRKPSPVRCGALSARVLRGPREDGRWYWRCEPRRAGVKVTLWCDWATVREATDALKTLDDGDEPTRASTELVTVRDLLETWLGHIMTDETRKQRTRDNYHDCVTRILGDRQIDTTRLARFTGEDVAQYRDRMLRAGWAPGTVKQDMIAIGAAWKWAGRLEYVPDKRLHMAYPKRPKTAKKIAQRDIVARYVAWLREHAPEWVARLAWLLSAVGGRRMEVCSLRWADVDLDHSRLTIPDGKTGGRHVPLGPEAVAEIRSWAPTEPTLWGVQPNSAGAGLSLWCRACCEATGMPHLAAGMQRKQVANELRRVTDSNTYADIMGHSPITAALHYQEADDADRELAVLAARLGVLPVAPVERGGNVVEFRRKS